MSTSTKTPWRIVELDDGTPWLTDGHNFGMDVSVAPELLALVEEIRRKYGHLMKIDDTGRIRSVVAKSKQE